MGIAMGKGGTEVAKQASAIVVTDDNFATIVSAVQEGRGVYLNIRKTIQYLLAGNVGELLFITVCFAAGLPIPLLPIHLLWINLVTDGLPALCLASDPVSSAVMKARPRGRGDKLADTQFWRGIFLTGVVTAAVTMVMYVYARGQYGVQVAMTYAFSTLVFAELLRSFGARSDTEPLSVKAVYENGRLAIVVFLGLAVQIGSHHSELLRSLFKTVPVGTSECVALFLMGAVPLLATEIMKRKIRAFP